MNPITIWNRAYDTSCADEYSLAKLNVKATKKPEQLMTINTNRAIISAAIILEIC